MTASAQHPSTTIRRICRGALAAVASAALLAAPATALPPMLPPPVQVVEQPEMSFPDGTTFDFGEIWDHETVEHEFVFENTGATPFEITRLRSTCGCTISAVKNSQRVPLPEGGRIFAPGERGIIVAEFNPNRRSGQQAKPIYISVNGAQQPQFTVRIRARVTPVIELEPDALYFRGVERFGERPTQEFSVTGRGSDFEAEIHENLREDIFTVEHVSIEDVVLDDEPARKFTWRVSVKEGLRAGRTRAVVTINTSDERRDRVGMPLSASVLGDLAADPPRLNLGSMIPNAPFRTSFIVSSKTRREFDIQDVRIEGAYELDGIVEWTPVDPLKRDQYEITLSGRAQAFPRQAGRLRVVTDFDKENIITVHYLGWVNQQQLEQRPAGNRP